MQAEIYMKEYFDKAVKIIIDTFNPDKIILFGSQARGDNNIDSDYDILVIKEHIKNKIRETQDIYKVLLNTNLSIDIILSTPEDFDKNKNNKYLIYKDIERYGKLIYERKTSA